MSENFEYTVRIPVPEGMTEDEAVEQFADDIEAAGEEVVDKALRDIGL